MGASTGALSPNIVPTSSDTRGVAAGCGLKREDKRRSPARGPWCLSSPTTKRRELVTREHVQRRGSGSGATGARAWSSERAGTTPVVRHEAAAGLSLAAEVLRHKLAVPEFPSKRRRSPPNHSTPSKGPAKSELDHARAAGALFSYFHITSNESPTLNLPPTPRTTIAVCPQETPRHPRSKRYCLRVRKGSSPSTVPDC